MQTWVAWIILSAFAVAGVAGSVLPALPGIALIFAGVLIHKLLLPDVLSGWVVAFVGVSVFLSWGIDFIGSAVGARWGGATRWGLIGAAAGGLVGLFFGLPGLILGPVAGAFIGELLAAGRGVFAATRAGVGAGMGLALSTALRLALALLCVALIVVDCVFF